MLEPLSAFAAAGNILQFIEIGAKLVVGISEVYRSSDGMRDEHKSLQAVVERIENSSSLLDQIDANGLFKSDTEVQNLVRVKQTCLALSADFLKLLEKFRSQKSDSSLLESFKLTVKGALSQGALKRMERQITHARSDLMLALLVYLTTRYEKQERKWDKGGEKWTAALEKRHDNLLHKLEHSNNLLETRIAALASTLSIMTINEKDKAQNCISTFRSSGKHQNNRGEHQTLATNVVLLEQMLDSHLEDLKPHLLQQFEAQKSSRNSVDRLKEQKQKAVRRCMQSLLFEEIEDRGNRIAKAHPNTFEWIMKSQKHQRILWDDFNQWLNTTHDKSIYWIRGKPGSGKSTLMRYIDEHLQSNNYNAPDSGSTERCGLIIASSYLWNAGVHLQRSLMGVLQTLVYRIFSKMPDMVVATTSDDRWKALQNFELPMAQWSTNELQGILRSFVECLQTQPGSQSRVIFLVDGLDECEGTDDQRLEMISFLKILSGHSNVLLCISSRPWVIYKDAFDECPQLRLEDLTAHDIRVYVEDQLQQDKLFQRLAKSDSQLTETVVQIILHKAEGVFLWVRLVVRDLLKILRDGAMPSQLLKLLTEIPSDLGDYFMRMMRQIDPRYRKDAAIIMQLALCDLDYSVDHLGNRRGSSIEDCTADSSAPDFLDRTPGPKFSLRHLCYLDEDANPEFLSQTNVVALDFSDDENLEYVLDVLERRLTSRCMGLLETSRAYPSRLSYKATIEFLHRTVRDFLMTPEVQEIIFNYSNGPYDSLLFSCNAMVADVQSVVASHKKLDSSPLVFASCLIYHLWFGALRSESICSLFEKLCNTLHATTSYQEALDEYTFVQTPSVEKAVSATVLENMRGWDAQYSPLLPFAIQQDLKPVIKRHLIHNELQIYGGRPMLDYALRPSIIVPRVPDLRIVRQIIMEGGDLHYVFEENTVLTHFVLTAQTLLQTHHDELFQIYKLLLTCLIPRPISFTNVYTALHKLRKLRGTWDTSCLIFNAFHRGFERRRRMEGTSISKSVNLFVTVTDLIEVTSESNEGTDYMCFTKEEIQKLDDLRPRQTSNTINKRVTDGSSYKGMSDQKLPNAENNTRLEYSNTYRHPSSPERAFLMSYPPPKRSSDRIAADFVNVDSNNEGQQVPYAERFFSDQAIPPKKRLKYATADHQPVQ